MDSIFVCFFVMVRREVYIGMGSLVAVGVVGDARGASKYDMPEGVNGSFSMTNSGGL